MKAYIHAKNNSKEFDGVPEDYIKIHQFIDHTKDAFPGMKHRIFLHNSFGIYIVEQVFGHVITNSDNKEVCVRTIAEKHILEDLGFIPSLEDCSKIIEDADWLYGSKRPEIKKEIVRQ
mgnify:CR=1 FL=1